MVRFSTKKICGKCNKPFEEIEVPTENFPFVGFWKHDASDHFGYEITSGENGSYYVMFRGPGGSSDHGKEKERFKTTIIHDKRFKVQDFNTMQIKSIFRFLKIQRYKNRCSEELEIFSVDSQYRF